MYLNTELFIKLLLSNPKDEIMNKSLMLNKIKSHYNIKYDKDFAEFLGIKQQNLSAWHQRNTYDVYLIYEKCPEISAHWLLTGKGQMLSKDSKEIPFYSKPERFSEQPLNNYIAEYIDVLKKENNELKEKATSTSTSPLGDSQTQILFSKVFSKLEEIDNFMEIVRLKVEIEKEIEQLNQNRNLMQNDEA